MKLGAAVAAGLLAMGVCSPTHALTFGLFFNEASPDARTELSEILTGRGDTVTVLTEIGLSAANLSGVDVLWILNGHVGAQATEMADNAGAISSFVQAGGVLLYHDRNVQDGDHDPDTADDLKLTLPGGGDIDFVFEAELSPVPGVATQNIEILDGSTLVTDGGPGRIIGATTLDNGNLSNHGYADAGSLPMGAVKILGRTANEVVDFGYELGLGFVYYSTIPLDHYLAGGGSSPANDGFVDIYAPNVAAYAASLVDGPSLPAPEPATLLLLGGGLLGLGFSRRRR